MMKKQESKSLDSAIVGVWKREIGQISTRKFAHRVAASEDLVLRLDLLRKLDNHRGCVNAVSFNSSGDILVSGSDDKRVILWDWETGHIKLSFHSGHHNNVFQAKFMPYSEDQSIVTCAADGQVRHAQILECGKVETKLLAKHQGRAHKLAIEPGSPHIFYTCGEDGLVQHIDLRSGTATGLFTCKPSRNRSYRSIVPLNTIAMDPRNPNLFAVGGSDPFARLYDIRKNNCSGSSGHDDRPVDYFSPHHLVDDEQVSITGLAFSEQSELLVSYNDEFIYLFNKDIGLGPNITSTSESSDLDEKTAPQCYKGHRNRDTVKGVNFFGPKCEYIVSGSDCGRIFIWKKKGGELIRVMEADRDVVNCIVSHPHATVLASSGIEHDVKIWVPKAIDRATLPTNIQKRRPRPSSWMHQMVSPEDLMVELFSFERHTRRSSPGASREHSDVERDLIGFLMSFQPDSNDVSSDDDDGDNSAEEGSGSDVSSHDDDFDDDDDDDDDDDEDDDDDDEEDGDSSAEEGSS